MIRFRTLAPLGALALLPALAGAQAKPKKAIKVSKDVPAAPAAAPAAPELPRKYVAKPTQPAITTGDLMSRLYVFADDSMQGREAGTLGHMKGTQYIAEELFKLGLQPAGDSGTYFQDVPFVSRRFDTRSVLTINGKPYGPGTDFVPLPFRGAGVRPLDGVQAVYGGVLGDSTRRITAEQAAGKIVVLTPSPTSAGRGDLSHLAGAAAIVYAGATSTLPAPQLATMRNVTMTLKPTDDMPRIAATLFGTRNFVEALLGAPVEGMAPGTLGRTVAGNLRYIEDEAPTRNVVAILPGSDKKLKGQYVAVGAHSDHIGFRAAGPVDHDSLHAFGRERWFLSENPSGARRSPEQEAELRAKVAAIRVNVDSMHGATIARRDSINNGADDDGSGTVTVLEVAEAFAKGKVKPKRSILFVWHTGEEKGLLGSRWFADHPTVPRDSIVAQINIDMVGRGAATDLAAGGPSYLQLVGSRRLSTELGDLTETVNKTQKMPFTFDYAFDANGHPDNIYCRSDHYNYARYGIPVVFMTTGLHGDYHQVTDEPQYIDYPHMARVGNFVYDLTTRVANLDHRPVVDKEKPDPLGSCRQ